MKKLAITFVLCALIIVTRVVAPLAPNIEFVTAAIIAGTLVLPLRFTGINLLLVLATLGLTDIILGSSAIMLFTWSGFALMYLPALLIRVKAADGRSRIAGSVIAAVLGTTIFFVWTNLGVVIVSGLYPQTLDGLLQSYINALPFLRNQLAGNLIFVPAVTFAVSLACNQAVASSGLPELAEA